MKIPRLPLLLVLLALSWLPSVTRAQQTPAPKRVLVLYWYDKVYQGQNLWDQNFQAFLPGNLEYYPEYLEANRFPGENQSQALRDYLLKRYSDRSIDVVVANSEASLNFLLKYRNDLFPHVPIVFYCVSRPLASEIQGQTALTGIVIISSYKRTLELALNLNPQVNQVFVVSGSLEHDRRFEVVAREELREFEGRIKINYLTDLSPNELIAKTATLPDRSLVLYAWQQARDDQGKVLESGEILSSISKATPVPIFGMSVHLVGRGIIGGHVYTVEAAAGKVAEVVGRIANGERAEDIPIQNVPTVPMFDWRELKRWGISENRLPPGSIVRFKDPTFWDQYKWRIVGGFTIILLQAALIAVLLVERRRRQRAKLALDQLNSELEERIAARTAALNNKSRELETFAYSVAHDLKAPLRGIDGYSRRLVEDYSRDLPAEVRSFIQTIQASSEEMSQLIDDLLDYSRLERREFKPDRLVLHRLITKLVDQKRRDAAERNINFVINVDGGTVLADANSLIQSLGNYLDNAVKFTHQTPQPRVEVGSKETATSCLIWVRDNGIGFESKYSDQIFGIFQRLNPAEEYPGTGIGLAIVRKAMERMGGRAWAESEPGGGATFYLEIPKMTQSEVDRT